MTERGTPFRVRSAEGAPPVSPHVRVLRTDEALLDFGLFGGEVSTPTPTASAGRTWGAAGVN